MSNETKATLLYYTMWVVITAIALYRLRKRGEPPEPKYYPTTHFFDDAFSTRVLRNKYWKDEIEAGRCSGFDINKPHTEASPQLFFHKEKR